MQYDPHDMRIQPWIYVHIIVSKPFVNEVTVLIDMHIATARKFQYLGTNRLIRC